MDIDTHDGEGTDPAATNTGAPLDFTTQTGNADGAEWQEEVYQKIKSMKEKYLLDINDVYRIFASKVQQGQLPQSPIQLQQPQFPDGQTNPPMQPVHGSLSGKSTIYNSQQHRILSPATGFSQQNPVNSPQEVNISSLSSQNGTNPVQENLCSLWENSSVLQQSLLKLQEQQMLQDQQLRQTCQQQQTFHSQHLMQFQQLIHRNQLMQQQLTQLQQQTVQLLAHQMSQLHQMTDANDLNMRQQMGMKTGVLQQQQSVGQRVGFHHPQVRSEISSPQAYEAVYPQKQNLPAVDESKNIAYMPWNFQ